MTVEPDKSRQEDIQIRNAVRLGGIDGRVAGDKVPCKVMGDKAPRNEMIQVKSPFIQCPPGIDTMDWSSCFDDSIPEEVLPAQGSSVFGTDQLPGNVGHIRVSDLSEEEYELAATSLLEDRTAGYERRISKVRHLDASIAESLKRLYDFRCQITGH